MVRPQVTGYGRVEKDNGSYFLIASINTGDEDKPTGTAEIRYPITLRDYEFFTKMIESSKADPPRLKIAGNLEISAAE